MDSSTAIPLKSFYEVEMKVGGLLVHRMNFARILWIESLRVTSGPAMTATPFKAKAEERARLKKEEADGDSPEPPSKRVCNTYEKQITKMPDGDLQTVKEINFRFHSINPQKKKILHP